MTQGRHTRLYILRELLDQCHNPRADLGSLCYVQNWQEKHRFFFQISSQLNLTLMLSPRTVNTVSAQLSEEKHSP